MGESISRRTAVKLTLFVTVVTTAVAVPTAVWASHHFNDVPTNHPFHAEISAIADAGITTGFPDGGFHPSANVTRQAMAAFLERGLGRVAYNTTAAGTNETLTIPNTGAFANLTGVAIEAGADGSGTAGFVLLDGTAYFTATVPASCPCHVELSIWDSGPLTQLAMTKVDVSGSGNEYASAIVPASVQTVFRLDGGTTGRFLLRARLFDAQQVVTGVGSLTAVYLPFGASGDDSLAYCSVQDVEPNGSIAEATATGGQPVDGCISPAVETDFWSVVVPAGASLIAWTSGVGGFDTCDMDTYIRIRNSAGTILDEDDNSGFGYCSYASTGVLTAGTYYVSVERLTGSGIGSYRLATELD